MKIVISGGSGLIGQAVARQLVDRGDEVVILSRSPDKVTIGRGVEWSPGQPGDWSEEVSSADAVVNLAGANLGEGRWTPERKKLLLSSRVESTSALVEAFCKSTTPGRAFISASGVGYYGSRGDETITEESSAGDDFLARLCLQWEGAARPAEECGRLVILRLGVVLSPEGGAVAKMLLPFRLGLGGRIGSGKQWWSWIDLRDASRMIVWAIGRDEVQGVYNATAPAPVTSAGFTRALGRALRRPTVFPLPAAVLELLLGEMAEAMLLTGQKVLPVRAQKAGFPFEHPTIEEALKTALR